jgi:hypothetical protein
MGGCGLDSSVAASCEHGHEHSDSTKCGEFLGRGRRGSRAGLFHTVSLLVSNTVKWDRLPNNGAGAARGRVLCSCNYSRNYSQIFRNPPYCNRNRSDLLIGDQTKANALF